LCKPATTPEEFVAAVEWCLGGAFKLCFVPGFLIGVLEAINNLLVLNSFHVPDIAVGFPIWVYLLIFIFGYAITASEKRILKNLMMKYRWIYFILGFLFCLLYSILLTYERITERDNPVFSVLIVAIGGCHD
jgi:hypothetical protein